MNLWQELKEESRNLVENYRTLARKGMGTETKNSARVGLELDFYEPKNGDKRFGKITKMSSKGYQVKDDKGKTYSFLFHDRKKAQSLLRNQVEETVAEGTMAIGIFDNNPSEKKKAIAGLKKLLKGVKGSVKVGSPEGKKFFKQLDMKYISDDELADDFARPQNKNMSVKDLMKKHEKRLNIRFEEVEEAVSPAQQAAIAIAKKEKGEKPKNESVMDAYRQMWEDGQKYAPQLDEEVSNLTVDPRNKLSKPADQNKHALEIVKNARRFGLKASMMGKHVRLKGAKKAVNDFLRTVVGRSSYGDPTEKDTSTPQIDKMLTKDLK